MDNVLGGPRVYRCTSFMLTLATTRPMALPMAVAMALAKRQQLLDSVFGNFLSA